MPHFDGRSEDRNFSTVTDAVAFSARTREALTSLVVQRHRSIAASRWLAFRPAAEEKQAGVVVNSVAGHHGATVEGGEVDVCAQWAP